MSNKDQPNEERVPLTPRKTRRARPTTYQLDLTQRRNSDEHNTWNSPPRPQLQRSPHSSPVLFSSATRQKDISKDRDAYASQCRAPAGENVSTQQYQLPRLSFGNDIRSDLDSFDHVFSDDNLSDRPRLRRVARMKTTRNLRAESPIPSPPQPPQRRVLAVVHHTTSRPLSLSSPTFSALSDPSAIGRIKQYSFDDQAYYVHFVDYTIGDVLSSRLPIDRPISPTSELYLNGIMFLYDATKTDVLLFLPGLLDVLKQAKLPVALVPTGTTISEHETRILSDAIDRQCDLVENDVEVFRAPATLNPVEDCVSLLLARIEERSDGEFSPYTQPGMRLPRTKGTVSASSPFIISSQQNGEKLDRYRSRNDSKVSHQSNHSNLELKSIPPPSPPDVLKSSKTTKTHTSDHRGKVLHDLDTLKVTPEHSSRPSTLEDLVSRLLKTATSNTDQKFTTTFLTVYKLFATPLQLLTTMLVCSGANNMEYRNGVTTGLQARLVAVVHFWIVSFPGDLASAPVADCLKTYLFAFSSDDPFQARRQQIRQALDAVVVNDDTHWACCDKIEEPGSGIPNLGKIVTQERRRSTYRLTPISPASSQISNSSAQRHNEKTSHLEGSPTTEEKRPRLPKVNSRPRLSLSGFQRPSLSPSSSSSTTTAALGRSHWRMFIDLPIEILAQAIATIDRHLFLATKPRDFVRQITLTATRRPKFTSLASIAELTAQFNHLAHWTASLVLVREKAKDRAQTLEKLMKVARRVREFNDYNGVGAIVAGIHNTAIHRLSATRELLDKDIAKDFARLEILMGTGKGHGAYRLAWENTSFKGRVPYMPVILSDLVVADACGTTFADHPSADTPISPAKPPSLSGSERTRLTINWHKFALMGETLHQLEAARAAIPPHAPLDSIEHEDARVLLLDAAVMEDDDELYARSCLLEPSVSYHTVEDGSARRRFMDKLITLGSGDPSLYV